MQMHMLTEFYISNTVDYVIAILYFHKTPLRKMTLLILSLIQKRCNNTIYIMYLYIHFNATVIFCIGCGKTYVHTCSAAKCIIIVKRHIVL